MKENLRLAVFGTWENVMEYTSDPTCDPFFKRVVKLIIEKGAAEVLRLIATDVPAEMAEVQISTVHQSKGLTSPIVKLGSDFDPLADDRTEAMILYVAVTRAQFGLDLSDCPAFSSAAGHLARTFNDKPRQLNI